MLKNILRLLLTRFYSKNESALVARQSLPDTPNYIDWSSSVVINENGAYIAPDDGYVVLAAKTSENSGVNLWGSLDVSVPASSRVQAKVFCPCKKGTKINYFLWGELHLARFYKFIGGGYQTLKRLLQGGGLCLKHSYSSLRRRSLQVRRGGLLNNVTCRFRMLLPFLFQTIQPCILTFLQQTVCWCWGNLVRQEIVIWKLTRAERDLTSINPVLEFTKDSQYRLIEVKQFLSRQLLLIEEIIQLCTLSRSTAKVKLGLGGAL